MGIDIVSQMTVGVSPCLMVYQTGGVAATAQRLSVAVSGGRMPDYSFHPIQQPFNLFYVYVV